MASPARLAARLSTPEARRPRNVALWAGLGLVGLVALVALIGPDVAPSDPLQDTYIKEDFTGEWVRPPFKPLTVPGFPLGSDTFGRDLFSQMLWAVRPTLTLVLTAAALRITVGIVVGLIAGWSVGRVGRLFGSAISAALSVPVLFVALCVITLFGVRYGVWAFIAGLVLTGWADVARVLAEHTRGIKQRPYVEAARALGSSDPQLIYRHVLPQVMPLVWTMLAFEVSSALLTTAALGFLGYYIHSIWMPLGDWTGIRAAGKPELGQMLAAGFEMRATPWGMVIAGSVVFLTVLGFNLLGEGLRLRQNVEGRRQAADAETGVSGRVNDFIEGHLFDPLSPWRRTLTFGSAAGVLLLVIGVGGFNLWQSQSVSRVIADLPVPGGHLWGMERHDPYGTLRAPAAGLASADVQWTFRSDLGWSGGPVVAADGTLYVASLDATLYALSQSGGELWRATLPTSPVGAPALNAFGDIALTDRAGGVTVIDRHGQQLWTLPGDNYSAIAGPTIGPDGTIYFPTEGHITAVTPEGTLKWRRNLPFYAYTFPVLALSPDGAYVFFEDVALDTATGALLTDRTVDPFDRFFVGVDGEIYLGGANALLQWRETDLGAEIAPVATFDPRLLALGFRSLQAAGVTPEQRLWLLFNSPFEFPKLVWYNLDGSLREFVDLPYRFAWLAAVDRDSNIIICGLLQGQGLECRALPREGREPLWRLTLDEGGAGVNGAALVPGRLYVTSIDGVLYALGGPEAAP